ncbi:MAG: hypothetical protein M1479_10815 [Actinobacteria bacterium]|nr:hypothetical protein [Actinomycetota bacterium]
MITAIYLYNLKKGISINEYKKWSIERDQKIVNSFEGIKSFEVYINKGPDKRWDVFEILQAESWERWVEIGKSPEMNELKEEHKELVDRDSIIKFYGEKII